MMGAGRCRAYAMVRLALTVEADTDRSRTDTGFAYDVLARFHAPFVAHLAALALDQRLIEASDYRRLKRVYRPTPHPAMGRWLQKNV
jgi:hypothetical protein